jgi:L-asparaginase
VAHIQLLGTGGTIVGTAPPRRSHQPLPLPSAGFDTARVEIITAHPGATPDLMNFAVRVGAQAIVLTGPAWATRAPASPSESRKPSRADAR